MTKYRVEAKLINLSDGEGIHAVAVEFDTGADTPGLINDRLLSIPAAILWTIQNCEDSPNPQELSEASIG